MIWVELSPRTFASAHAGRRPRRREACTGSASRRHVPRSPTELARDTGKRAHVAEPFGLACDNGRRAPALPAAAVRTRPRRQETRTGSASRRHMPRSRSNSPATMGGVHRQSQSSPHVAKPFGLTVAQTDTNQEVSWWRNVRGSDAGHHHTGTLGRGVLVPAVRQKATYITLLARPSVQWKRHRARARLQVRMVRTVSHRARPAAHREPSVLELAAPPVRPCRSRGNHAWRPSPWSRSRVAQPARDILSTVTYGVPSPMR